MYTKPMVTIELDEYNELLKKAEPVDPSGWETTARRIAAAVINSRAYEHPALREEFRKNGIAFGYNNTKRFPMLPEDIIIHS